MFRNLLILLSLFAVPSAALASGFGRGSHHSSSSSHSSSHDSDSDDHQHAAAPVGSTPSGAHGAAPVGSSSSGGYAEGYGGGYRGGHRGYVGYRGREFWGVHPWGYYGWGYYPYAGAPIIAAEGAPEPPSFTASIFLGGMLSRNDEGHHLGGLDLALRAEGQRFGLSFDVLTLPSADPGNLDDVTTMPLLKGDLTYSLISDLHARVRVEGGVAGISAPGVTYIGPDVGVSGQIALLGPLAIDGSAHLMPVPAYIWDLQAGLGLNFGSLAVRGGWRWVRLDDSSQCSDVGQSCGVDVFNGPTLSVGLVF